MPAESTINGVSVSFGTRAQHPEYTSMITTKMNDRLAPVHPGEVLGEEFLKPFNLSKYRLAKELHVPATRIGEIIDGKRAITADTALRLSRFFGTSAEFWINLQGQYDIEVTEQKEHDQLESVHRFQESKI
jgi:antitoxin HigA-1